MMQNSDLVIIVIELKPESTNQAVGDILNNILIYFGENKAFY